MKCYTKMLETIKLLVEIAEFNDDDYFEICKAIAIILPCNLKEQLKQLIANPVWDGDVISKTARDALLDLNLAVKVCAKGEQGYTAAKPIAYTILKKEN